MQENDVTFYDRLRGWLIVIGVIVASLHVAVVAVATIATGSLAGFGVGAGSINQNPFLFAAVSAQAMAAFLLIVGCVGWQQQRPWARAALHVAAFILIGGVLAQQAYFLCPPWMSVFQSNRLAALQMSLSIAMGLVYRLVYPVLLLVTLRHKGASTGFAGFAPILNQSGGNDRITP